MDRPGIRKSIEWKPIDEWKLCFGVFGKVFVSDDTMWGSCVTSFQSSYRG